MVIIEISITIFVSFQMIKTINHNPKEPPPTVYPSSFEWSHCSGVAFSNKIFTQRFISELSEEKQEELMAHLNNVYDTLGDEMFGNEADFESLATLIIGCDDEEQNRIAAAISEAFGEGEVYYPPVSKPAKKEVKLAQPDTEQKKLINQTSGESNVEK